MTSTTPPPRPKLEEALPHQLRRAAQAWAALWQQRLPDLTSPQFAVLLVLDDHGSLDQSALGALSAIDRSTLTVLLDRLVARGWVTRRTDPANRRRRIVSLTAAGRERLTAAEAEARALHARAQERLGERGLGQLVAMLRALGDLSEPPDDPDEAAAGRRHSAGGDRASRA